VADKVEVLPLLTLFAVQTPHLIEASPARFVRDALEDLIQAEHQKLVLLFGNFHELVERLKAVADGTHQIKIECR